MAELPEIYTIAQQMKSELVGKSIAGAEFIQPKCLNITPDAFIKAVSGARIDNVNYRGKWIFLDTTQGWVLLCLGMGGEFLLVNRSSLPEKRRAIIDFTDQTCLSINFWWFGYVHYTDQLEKHKMTSKLGINALDLDYPSLKNVFNKKRGTLKTYLLDQSRIAGIGNFYIHDILYQARLHPLRTLQTLSENEIHGLADAIHDRLSLSVSKGGFVYEMDLYGRKGGFDIKDLVIAYKENQVCPTCGNSIQKIKTGGTHSFICPECQKLPE